MRAVEVDYSPLSRRPLQQELDAVRAEALAGAFGEPTAEQVRTAKSRGWTMLAVFGGFITAIMAVTTLVQWIRGEGFGDIVVGVLVTAFLAAVCFAVYAVVRFVVEPRAWRHLVQLVLFCRSNGLTVEPVAEERPLPGTLGERSGRHGAIANRVTWDQDGLPVEVGVYRQASSGARGSAFATPYVAIRLPRPWPRMTFISRAAVAVAPAVTLGADVLPVDYPRRGSQRVRLVSAPANTELARRLFTDELIATLAEPAHPANAEVRGEWFLIYPRRDVSVFDEQQWRHIMAVVELTVRSVRAAVEPDPDSAAWEVYPGS